MTPATLFDYPRHPGSKAHQGPSAEAAARTAPRAKQGQADCLRELINHGPLTTDEVAQRLGLSVLYVRPRMSELKALGLIEPTGARRKNVSGMSATVWRARAAGITKTVRTQELCKPGE